MSMKRVSQKNQLTNDEITKSAEFEEWTSLGSNSDNYGPYRSETSRVGIGIIRAGTAT
jgi:hypothetical protein